MTQRKAAWYDKPSPIFVDAIALARRRLSLATEGYSLSGADPDAREPGEFWANPLTGRREKDHAGPAVIPDLAAALPQELGRFPLWRGNLKFVPAMQDIYHAASQPAVEHLMTAEPPDDSAPAREAEQAYAATAPPLRWRLNDWFEVAVPD